MIRAVRASDYRQWHALWTGYNAFYGREGATALPESITQQAWTRFLDPGEAMYAFVAETDGKLTGLAHFLVHRSTSRANDVCYLQDLFTAPGQRGKGVARGLIEAVYERARELGCSRVYWHTMTDNATARLLYDRVGEHKGAIVYVHELRDGAATAPSTWHQRVSALWTQFDAMDAEAFVEGIDALARESDASPAVALFERAGARDSVGRTNEAIPLYREALAAGLQAERRQAVVQLASSLRALGHAQEAADLLIAEMKSADDELNEAVAGFLALTLADLGREREALAFALDALSHYLPRYRRSLAAYAARLTSHPRESGDRD